MRTHKSDTANLQVTADFSDSVTNYKKDGQGKKHIN